MFTSNCINLIEIKPVIYKYHNISYNQIVADPKSKFLFCILALFYIIFQCLPPDGDRSLSPVDVNGRREDDVTWW